MTCYVVDTSVFIDAADWYPMDIFPAFWRKIEELVQDGYVVSIDAVYHEILEEEDSLSRWATESFHGWRPAKGDPVIGQYYTQIAQYIDGLSSKSRAAKDNFLKGADGWLVAYARAKSATVVTHEKSVTSSSKKIKIPDVCNHFCVTCVHLFDMLRQLNVVI
jgi:hypothetical protein